ncbi:MAG TPA: tetratricopeptide repeat protein [Noviherbaspirillum sp.]|nr:tetratricopeptide repeat protein [Noviherbaspirillum sp.]
MSLINQMLKDLDARRSDVSGGGAFGQQIRAVPEKRRIHPAWWVAVALGGMLIGVVGYILLRPTPPTAPEIGTQLPLKLDVDLAASRSGTPLAAPLPPPETQAAPANASQQVRLDEAPAVAKKPAASEQVSETAEQQAAKPKTQPVVPTVREKTSKPSPAAADADTSEKVIAPVPQVKPAEAVTASAINKQVKELTPAQRAESEYRRAVQALQQGKRTDAFSGLEQAIQMDPKHTAARQALIGLLLDAKLQDEAIQRAREGIGADRAQTGLAMILARLQLEKGELRLAIETLERSLPYAAEKADYLAFLAALLQRDERHKQAVEHYLLALRKVPQNGVWWMGLGISLQAERRNQEAQESFRRAKATNSLSPELLAFVEGRLSQLQP